MSTKTDDRIIMLSMKKFINNLKFLNSDVFKNMVIVFGMALSLFTITSFDTISHAGAGSETIENQVIEKTDVVSQTELNNQPDISIASQKTKTHHNFIASYLLQESSVKRQPKKSEVEENFIGDILKIHKVIISRSLRFF